MHPVAAWIARLPKKLLILIPASMIAGLVVGAFVDLSPLKSLILPLTMLMVYPMLVNFRPAEALHLKDAKAVGIAMAVNFALLPLVAWGLAQLFFGGRPEAFVGMVMIGLFPTSGMTISWTGFAKGNVAAALKMTVIGLLVASVLAPVYLLVLAGTVVDVDVVSVGATVLLVVFVPMVAGVATRKLLVARMGEKAYKQRAAKVFPGLSVIGVVAIVFLAIGLKAQMILSDPGQLVGMFLPILGFYAVAFAFTTLIGRVSLKRGDAIAMVYGTVMRNLSIALGIAIASFGPEAALVLALAYMVQVQSAAWYVKLADRLFGIPEPQADSSMAASTPTPAEPASDTKTRAHPQTT
jgi:ACR3 family arsenite efflux pump ArsB